MSASEIGREMIGVREHAEGLPVYLATTTDGRTVIKASNEAGCNHTQVDLYDLIAWLQINMPMVLRADIPIGTVLPLSR